MRKLCKANKRQSAVYGATVFRADRKHARNREVHPQRLNCRGIVRLLYHEELGVDSILWEELYCNNSARDLFFECLTNARDNIGV